MEQTAILLLMVLTYSKFKAKDSKSPKEMHLHYLYAMFQKKFSVDNLKMTGLYGYVYDFTVDYESIDVAETFYICKYLMQKT